MNYWINSHGPQKDETGLAWLDECLEQGQTGLLAVCQKQNLQNTVTSEVLGIGPSKALLVGALANLPSGGMVRLMTKRIPPAGWGGGPVLAVHPDPALLAIIAQLPGVSDLLVIPWNLQEVQAWVAQQAAVELPG
jgi:hypothetical protein